TSKQAQDIIQGKKVDTVTFNQVTDVDILAKRRLLNADWATEFPNNSSPYYSTIGFLVREGNPKNIQSWDDLVRDDVKVVFPNPKTSGNARYTYLAAWLFANEKFNGDEAKIKKFVGKLLHNVENFPTGGRGATVAFAQKDRKSTRLNSSHVKISYAVFCCARQPHAPSMPTRRSSDLKVVFPNPKTSGNARYTYLAAWLFANEKFNGDEAKIKKFVGKLLHNVENFPTGGRGATVAFAQNGQGDALLTFESEVINIAKHPDFAAGKFQPVIPPLSVLAEFPVAIVDKVVDQKGTRKQATEFLNFQYTQDVQQLLTTFNLRVHHPQVVEATKAQFAEVKLVNPTE